MQNPKLLIYAITLLATYIGDLSYPERDNGLIEIIKSSCELVQSMKVKYTVMPTTAESPSRREILRIEGSLIWNGSAFLLTTFNFRDEKSNTTRERFSNKLRFEFDGEGIMRTLNEVPSVLEYTKSGVISCQPPHFLDTQLTPLSFLGKGLFTNWTGKDENSRYVTKSMDIGDILRQNSDRVVIDTELESLGEDRCISLDAQVVGETIHSKIWLCPEKGYSMIRFLEYDQSGARMEYEVLAQKYLEEHGFWFPTKGRYRKWLNREWEDVKPYIETMLKAEGLNLDALQGLGMERQKELAGNLRYLSEDLTLEVDMPSLEINRPIPRGEMKISYPVGTAIWDDRMKLAYYVGAPREILEQGIALSMSADNTVREKIATAYPEIRLHEPMAELRSSPGNEDSKQQLKAQSRKFAGLYRVGGIIVIGFLGFAIAVRGLALRRQKRGG
jgi:hypothetical protein